MTLDDLILPSFAQMLEALGGQLDKATAAGFDASALLGARLAPDMFPLLNQVRFACLQATETFARLAGDPPPSVAEIETLEDAKALIARTVALLRSRDGAAATPPDSGAPLSLELANGMAFDFTLGEYVRSWALPQFYFHLVTAYAIMRREGVDLGKADYVPHMMGFLRAAAPAAS